MLHSLKMITTLIGRCPEILMHLDWEERVHGEKVDG
jgi:hypothetical protein